MNRIAILFGVLLPLSATAYLINLPPKTLTTSLSSATRADTACDEASSDVDSTATTSLSCADTGSLAVGGYNQLTLQVAFTRSAGTAVNMQCDTSESDAVPWATIQKTDTSSISTTRTWVRTTSTSGTWPWNIPINYRYIRCRFWVTGGGANDKIAVTALVAVL